MGKDFLEVVKARRSIRKYKPDIPVTEEQIHMLLEAAMNVPSAGNTRAWDFIVITNREKMNEIASVHRWAGMLRTATLCIVVCALPDLQSANDIMAEYYPQDCAAVTENILLQAVALGLGGCWCGVYPREQLIAPIRECLAIPDNKIPFNVIAIGVPDESPAARGGFDKSKVTYIR